MKTLLSIILIWGALLGEVPQTTHPSDLPEGMIKVPSGRLDRDGKKQRVKGFYMDKTPVTVAQFERFVSETNYKTEAEKLGNAGVYNFEKGEWELIDGAYWKFPLGPNQAQATAAHPVTQVSWNDVQVYCEWSAKRLPTVAEWEHAAKNAENITTSYTWGDKVELGGQYLANCWQGNFPFENLKKDGFEYTSPVGHFGYSKLGLADMLGNVWEWTVDEIQDSTGAKEKLLKGGSFMCEASVCHGYRIDGQTSCTTETALFHAGFRCVRDL